MDTTSLIDRIFSIQSENDFETCALEVFAYQYENVEVYRDFVDLLNKPKPTSSEEIPFLPIQFFKTHAILSKEKEAVHQFKSSGTGSSVRSSHFVADLSIYERSFLPTFEAFIGSMEDTVILALLPSYVEQGESSLVYMVDKLITASNNPLSGYYLEDLQVLVSAAQEAHNNGKKVVLFGVSYALLDLAELNPDLSFATIIETGGMKGRRKEMSKEELHQSLKTAFGCSFISSEYGMCELLSQAYSNANGLFRFPVWMKAQLRDLTDPFKKVDNDNKTGVINIIDLANIYSCSFIETQDLGRIENDELRLMGRLDYSEIRGCNLLIE